MLFPSAVGYIGDLPHLYISRVFRIAIASFTLINCIQTTPSHAIQQYIVALHQTEFGHTSFRFIYNMYILCLLDAVVVVVDSNAFHMPQTESTTRARLTTRCMENYTLTHIIVCRRRDERSGATRCELHAENIYSYDAGSCTRRL